MPKETFRLRSEWIEDLDLLSGTERGELLTMLFEYAYDGEITVNASKETRIVFNMWKREIDKERCQSWEKPTIRTPVL